MSEKTCRICLKSGLTCVSLENTSKISGESYAEMYNFVCSLLPKNDPRFLCEICKKSLITSYRFKQQILKSEEILSKKCIKPENFLGEPQKTEVIVFKSNLEDLLKEENDSDHFEDPPIPSQSTSDEHDTIQCPLCPYKGTLKSNYRKHVKRIHNNQKLKCEACSDSFHLIYVLLEHRKAKHGIDGVYKVVQEEKKEPEVEIKDTKGKKLCPHCDERFISYKFLRQHCTEKHPEQKYACPDCNERFSLPYHLKKHRRQAHNYHPPENLTTICGYCGKFYNAKSIESHIKNIHFKIDTEYTCDMCLIKISTKPGLINHMKSKHLETSYNCRFCPEVFQNYSCRRTHEVRFHTFDYKYTCNYCPNKKFMERVQLRKHLATHTGERRYRCEQCAMAFITLTNLKLHLASHSDERPYACHCNAAFKTKMALRKHQRIHEERNYECPVCSSKYLVNQQLRVHIKRNHPEYDLPPPGTVMNKSALKRINAVTEKYKVQVSPSVGLSSRKSNF